MAANVVDAIYNEGIFSELTEGMLERLLQQVESASIGPQVLYICKRMGYFSNRNQSNAFQEKLEQLHRAIVGQNLFIRYHTDKLLAALDSLGISVIPLKGVLFAERFFGDGTARATSDIDLLVNRIDIPGVINCLRGIGFHGPEVYNPLHFHCVMWKKIQPNLPPLSVEIHWSLIHSNNSTAGDDWTDFWGDAEPLQGYRYVKQLSVQHTFYAICLHGANHRLESLKYILDVAQLLFFFGNDIDYSRLFQVCKTHKTLRRVRAVLNLTYERFPILYGRKPLPYKCKKRAVLQRIILKTPILSVDSWGIRFRIIREWAWPLREVAFWHVRHDPKATYGNVYIRFYRQRLLNLFKSFAGRS